MLTSQDFKELLSAFERHQIRYLVVGGYAVMKYGEPRFTKDLDIWISADKQNANSVYTALGEFGAPLIGICAADFENPAYFYQMGRPPLRVDIMMSLPGPQFDGAWERREVVRIGEINVPFISKSDLIAAKRASGRPQDLLDLEGLTRSE